jgi:hypothetical protein
MMLPIAITFGGLLVQMLGLLFMVPGVAFDSARILNATLWMQFIGGLATIGGLTFIVGRYLCLI